MDCVSPILDIVSRLWDCSSRRVVLVRHLDERVLHLEIAMDGLKQLRDDVKEEVEIVMERHREMVKVKRQVEGWLRSVESIENQVIVLIDEGKLELERKCFACCPRNIRRTYKIAKDASKKIEAVKELLEKGKFEAVIIERLHHRSQLVSEWPMENTVGLDPMVETLWGHIEDGNVGVIGLYGIGGVGKTTILKKINNEFSTRNHGFDFVIWVTQSKSADDFQEIVRRKLEISDHIWRYCSNENDKACEIFGVLGSTRFVLLLDDVQNRFDFQLTSVGIPLPDNQNQSKIIFTSRSEELCGYMGAQVRIKVECLPPEQALSLFSMTVGERILNSNPEIPVLAEIIAARCRGLPLALLTVGKAMASRKSPQDWRYAMEVLQSGYPSEFSGMGDHVFPLLKFSYDSLNCPVTRKCFLYCSIFPENHMISVDELIDLWIGEGLLTGSRDQGEFIINTLRLSCLLDCHGDDSTEFVSMHDMIRDMALWLARDKEENKNKVLVTRNARLNDQEFTKWVDSDWVSLWSSSDRKIIHFPPSCPNLSTLIIRDTLLNGFPSGFFDFNSNLKALDLSGNQGLVELPLENGRLRFLQYLNLSLTSITELPTGLVNLRNLRCLLLDYTMCFKEIPSREVMSCLPLLQVYSKMNGVMEYFDEANVSADDELAFLEVLEGFRHMNKICITIFCYPSLEKILRSCYLQVCIRKLTLMGCKGMTSLCPPVYCFPNLGRLEIFGCCELQEFRMLKQDSFGSLRQFHIGVCPLLLNLNCLAYARNLEVITILDCESMKEVISEEIVADEGLVLPKLKTISLTCLPSLETISRSPMCFSSLVVIEVSQCPCLRQLPFDEETATFLNKIRGETEWWEALVWDNDVVKEACRLKFISTSRRSSKSYEDKASTSKGKTAIILEST